MKDLDETDEIILTREVGIKEKKKKIEVKKLLISSSIIVVIGFVVISLIFLIGLAKKAL